MGRGRPIEITKLSCRTCLRKCALKSTKITAFISELYRILTNSEMKSEDYLKMICKDCESDLKKLSDFRERCLKTEERLRNFTPQEDVKIEEVSVPVQEVVVDVDTEERPEIKPEEEEEVEVKIETDEKDEPEDCAEAFNNEPDRSSDEDYGIEPLKFDPEVIKKKRIRKTPRKPGKKRIKTKKYYYDTVCDLCGFHTKNKYNFARHYDLHFRKADDPKYGCDMCIESNMKFPHKRKMKSWFNTKEAIFRHMRTFHLQKVTKRPCQQCGRIFPSSSSLQSHYFRKHIDPKDYEFECSLCHKRFYKKDMLDKHMVYHKGEKTIPCDICGIKFFCISHVKNHIANVHETTKNKCDYCGKQFASKMYLHQHLKIHKQEYSCPMCPGRTFSFITTLRSHLKSSHPELPLPPPGTRMQNFDWSQILGREFPLAGIK